MRRVEPGVPFVFDIDGAAWVTDLIPVLPEGLTDVHLVGGRSWAGSIRGAWRRGPGGSRPPST
ncbi:hypothetical protein [Winogradskya consettensis]|uniref:hypothetical protein n=1 Tax=Winogradskya consettensis TaxID=113560 RepID=UPI001BB3C8F0|nr:hypothetical protein [Actinoplanes consettensis]